MSSKSYRSREESSLPITSILALVGSLGAVIVVILLIGLAGFDTMAASAIVPGLVGLAVFVVGAIGLIRAAWATPPIELPGVGLHLAVVLAGGILAGGGWGAALGLALLGATALYLAHRAKPDDGATDGQAVTRTGS